MLVSGGSDSISCCHWLKTKYRANFEAVHFNHNVQIKNLEMEESVRQFCEELSIPLTIIKRGEELPDFSENTLRQWRIKMLEGSNKSYVTAHHLNDCVENYLMNCFHGVPEYMPIKWSTQFDGFSIHHPFLKIKKANILEYLKNNNLENFVVDDPTNYDVKYKRNWIRNMIVPQIESKRLGIEKIVLKKFYK